MPSLPFLHLGLCVIYGCSQSRELWFIDLIMYVFLCVYVVMHYVVMHHFTIVSPITCIECVM